VRIFAPGAEVGSIAQEHRDAEKLPGAIHKIRRLVEIRAQHKLEYRVEIDGGVGLDTVAEIVRAGTEILVAGNAVFGQAAPKTNAEKLLKAAGEATLQKA
jgi:ribulose-phosphate 3-epimerase